MGKKLVLNNGKSVDVVEVAPVVESAPATNPLMTAYAAAVSHVVRPNSMRSDSFEYDLPNYYVVEFVEDGVVMKHKRFSKFYDAQKFVARNIPVLETRELDLVVTVDGQLVEDPFALFNLQEVSVFGPQTAARPKPKPEGGPAAAPSSIDSYRDAVDTVAGGSAAADQARLSGTSAARQYSPFTQSAKPTDHERPKLNSGSSGPVTPTVSQAPQTTAPTVAPKPTAGPVTPTVSKAPPVAAPTAPQAAAQPAARPSVFRRTPAAAAPAQRSAPRPSMPAMPANNGNDGGIIRPDAQRTFAQRTVASNQAGASEKSAAMAFLRRK